MISPEIIKDTFEKQDNLNFSSKVEPEWKYGCYLM